MDDFTHYLISSAASAANSYLLRLAHVAQLKIDQKLRDCQQSRLISWRPSAPGWTKWSAPYSVDALREVSREGDQFIGGQTVSKPLLNLGYRLIINPATLACAAASAAHACHVNRASQHATADRRDYRILSV
jgi:hypothetical protein